MKEVTRGGGKANDKYSSVPREQSDDNLDGWNNNGSSDNHKSSLIHAQNQAFDNIKSLKKDYVVTTTTKASIQIETTSSVFNNLSSHHPK